MKILSRSNLTNFGIFLSIALGIIFPAPDQLKKTIPLFLAILLISNFLKLEFTRDRFKRRELIFYPIMTYIVMPVIAYFATMPLPIDIRMGIFIIVISPVATAAPVVIDFIDGDRELLVADVIISNFAAPLIYSAMLYLFFHTANVKIPVLSLLWDVFLLIFIPLGISRLIKLNRTVLSASQKFFSYYTPIGFLFVIFVAVASSSAQLRHIDLKTLAIVMASVSALAVINFNSVLTGYLNTCVSDMKKYDANYLKEITANGAVAIMADGQGTGGFTYNKYGLIDWRLSSANYNNVNALDLEQGILVESLGIRMENLGGDYLKYEGFLKEGLASDCWWNLYKKNGIYICKALSFDNYVFAKEFYGDFYAPMTFKDKKIQALLNKIRNGFGSVKSFGGPWSQIVENIKSRPDWTSADTP